MAFSNETLLKAWLRQGGVCAHCGRKLVKGKRGENATGGWESHHRKPKSRDGSDKLINCVLFSVYPNNCHFNIGHGGISWDTYEPLDNFEIPYISHGKRMIKAGKAIRRRKPIRKASRKSANIGIIQIRKF